MSNALPQLLTLSLVGAVVIVLISLGMESIINSLDDMLVPCQHGTSYNKITSSCNCVNTPFKGKYCGVCDCAHGQCMVGGTTPKAGSLYGCRCPINTKRFGHKCNLCFTADAETECNGECLPGYYGAICDKTCKASLTQSDLFDNTLVEANVCKDIRDNGGICNFCSGHGTCGADGECQCDKNFFNGPEGGCSQTCQPASNGEICSGHGNCMKTGGTVSCACEFGFRGSDCSLPCPGILQTGDICSGHGNCLVDYSVESPTASCDCNQKFRGPACEIECPGEYTACSGHGTCDSVGVCTCNQPANGVEWVGRGCTCSDFITCSGNGVCDGTDNPSCSCFGNWDGNHCRECKENWYGSDCQFYCDSDGDDTTQMGCHGRGTCVVEDFGRKDEEVVCECDTGKTIFDDGSRRTYVTYYESSQNCKDCQVGYLPKTDIPNLPEGIFVYCGMECNEATCNYLGTCNEAWGNPGEPLCFCDHGPTGHKHLDDFNFCLTCETYWYPEDVRSDEGCTNFCVRDIAAAPFLGSFPSICSTGDIDCIQCSGNGDCGPDGQCLCDEGFSGSNCNIQCIGENGLECSGHGTCVVSNLQELMQFELTYQNNSGQLYSCECDPQDPYTDEERRDFRIRVANGEINGTLEAPPTKTYYGELCEFKCLSPPWANSEVCNAFGSCDVNRIEDPNGNYYPCQDDNDCASNIQLQQTLSGSSGWSAEKGPFCYKPNSPPGCPTSKFTNDDCFYILTLHRPTRSRSKECMQDLTCRNYMHQNDWYDWCNTVQTKQNPIQGCASDSNTYCDLVDAGTNIDPLCSTHVSKLASDGHTVMDQLNYCYEKDKSKYPFKMTESYRYVNGIVKHDLVAEEFEAFSVKYPTLDMDATNFCADYLKILDVEVSHIRSDKLYLCDNKVQHSSTCPNEAVELSTVWQPFYLRCLDGSETPYDTLEEAIENRGKGCVVVEEVVDRVNATLQNLFSVKSNVGQSCVDNDDCYSGLCYETTCCTNTTDTTNMGQGCVCLPGATSINNTCTYDGSSCEEPSYWLENVGCVNVSRGLPCSIDANCKSGVCTGGRCAAQYVANCATVDTPIIIKTDGDPDATITKSWCESYATTVNKDFEELFIGFRAFQPIGCILLDGDVVWNPKDISGVNCGNTPPGFTGCVANSPTGGGGCDSCVAGATLVGTECHVGSCPDGQMWVTDEGCIDRPSDALELQVQNLLEKTCNNGVSLFPMCKLPLDACNVNGVSACNDGDTCTPNDKGEAICETFGVLRAACKFGLTVEPLSFSKYKCGADFVRDDVCLNSARETDWFLYCQSNNPVKFHDNFGVDAIQENVQPSIIKLEEHQRDGDLVSFWVKTSNVILTSASLLAKTGSHEVFRVYLHQSQVQLNEIAVLDACPITTPSCNDAFTYLPNTWLNIQVQINYTSSTVILKYNENEKSANFLCTSCNLSGIEEFHIEDGTAETYYDEIIFSKEIQPPSVANDCLNYTYCDYNVDYRDLCIDMMTNVRYPHTIEPQNNIIDTCRKRKEYMLYNIPVTADVKDQMDSLNWTMFCKFHQELNESISCGDMTYVDLESVPLACEPFIQPVDTSRQCVLGNLNFNWTQQCQSIHDAFVPVDMKAACSPSCYNHLYGYDQCALRDTIFTSDTDIFYNISGCNNINFVSYCENVAQDKQPGICSAVECDCTKSQTEGMTGASCELHCNLAQDGSPCGIDSGVGECEFTPEQKAQLAIGPYETEMIELQGICNCFNSEGSSNCDVECAACRNTSYTGIGASGTYGVCDASRGLCKCLPPFVHENKVNYTTWKGETRTRLQREYNLPQNITATEEMRIRMMQGKETFVRKYLNTAATEENWKVTHDAFLSDPTQYSCGDQACGPYEVILLGNLADSSFSFNFDCQKTCPGVDDNTKIPCSGHGRCGVDGLCVCDVARVQKGIDGVSGSTFRIDIFDGAEYENSRVMVSAMDATGWRGPTCALKCPGYDETRQNMFDVCNGHGICTSAASCQCEIGYTGEECQFKCPGFKEGDMNLCSGHGTCEFAETDARFDVYDFERGLSNQCTNHAREEACRGYGELFNIPVMNVASTKTVNEGLTCTKLTDKECYMWGQAQDKNIVVEHPQLIGLSSPVSLSKQEETVRLAGKALLYHDEIMLKKEFIVQENKLVWVLAYCSTNSNCTSSGHTYVKITDEFDTVRLGYCNQPGYEVIHTNPKYAKISQRECYDYCNTNSTYTSGLVIYGDDAGGCFCTQLECPSAYVTNGTETLTVNNVIYFKTTKPNAMPFGTSSAVNPGSSTYILAKDMFYQHNIEKPEGCIYRVEDNLLQYNGYGDLVRNDVECGANGYNCICKTSEIPDDLYCSELDIEDLPYMNEPWRNQTSFLSPYFFAEETFGARRTEVSLDECIEYAESEGTTLGNMNTGSITKLCYTTREQSVTYSFSSKNTGFFNEPRLGYNRVCDNCVINEVSMYAVGVNLEGFASTQECTNWAILVGKTVPVVEVDDNMKPPACYYNGNDVYYNSNGIPTSGNANIACASDAVCVLKTTVVSRNQWNTHGWAPEFGFASGNGVSGSEFVFTDGGLAYTHADGDLKSASGWLIMDLGDTFTLNSIKTQGGKGKKHSYGTQQVDGWVSKYTVSTSTDNVTYTTVGTYNGNIDAISIVENVLPSDLLARYVKLDIVEYSGTASLIQYSGALPILRAGITVQNTPHTCHCVDTVLNNPAFNSRIYSDLSAPDTNHGALDDPTESSTGWTGWLGAGGTGRYMVMDAQQSTYIYGVIIQGGTKNGPNGAQGYVKRVLVSVSIDGDVYRGVGQYDVNQDGTTHKTIHFTSEPNERVWARYVKITVSEDPPDSQTALSTCDSLGLPEDTITPDTDNNECRSLVTRSNYLLNGNPATRYPLGCCGVVGDDIPFTTHPYHCGNTCSDEVDCRTKCTADPTCAGISKYQLDWMRMPSAYEASQCNYDMGSHGCSSYWANRIEEQEFHWFYGNSQCTRFLPTSGSWGHHFQKSWQLNDVAFRSGPSTAYLRAAMLVGDTATMIAQCNSNVLPNNGLTWDTCDRECLRLSTPAGCFKNTLKNTILFNTVSNNNDCSSINNCIEKDYVFQDTHIRLRSTLGTSNYVVMHTKGGKKYTETTGQYLGTPVSLGFTDKQSVEAWCTNNECVGYHEYPLGADTYYAFEKSNVAINSFNDGYEINPISSTNEICDYPYENGMDSGITMVESGFPDLSMTAEECKTYALENNYAWGGVEALRGKIFATYHTREVRSQLSNDFDSDMSEADCFVYASSIGASFALVNDPLVPPPYISSNSDSTLDFIFDSDLQIFAGQMQQNRCYYSPQHNVAIWNTISNLAPGGRTAFDATIIAKNNQVWHLIRKKFSSDTDTTQGYYQVDGTTPANLNWPVCDVTHTVTSDSTCPTPGNANTTDWVMTQVPNGRVKLPDIHFARGCIKLDKFYEQTNVIYYNSDTDVFSGAVGCNHNPGSCSRTILYGEKIEFQTTTRFYTSTGQRINKDLRDVADSYKYDTMESNGVNLRDIYKERCQPTKTPGFGVLYDGYCYDPDPSLDIPGFFYANTSLPSDNVTKAYHRGADLYGPHACHKNYVRVHTGMPLAPGDPNFVNREECMKYAENIGDVFLEYDTSTQQAGCYESSVGSDNINTVWNANFDNHNNLGCDWLAGCIQKYNGLDLCEEECADNIFCEGYSSQMGAATSCSSDCVDSNAVHGFGPGNDIDQWTELLWYPDKVPHHCGNFCTDESDCNSKCKKDDSCTGTISFQVEYKHQDTTQPWWIWTDASPTSHGVTNYDTQPAPSMTKDECQQFAAAQYPYTFNDRSIAALVEVTSGAPVPITQKECELYAAADTSSSGFAGQVSWCDDFPSGCICTNCHAGGFYRYVTGCNEFTTQLDCGSTYSSATQICIQRSTSVGCYNQNAGQSLSINTWPKGCSYRDTTVHDADCNTVISQGVYWNEDCGDCATVASSNENRVIFRNMVDKNPTVEWRYGSSICTRPHLRPSDGPLNKVIYVTSGWPSYQINTYAECERLMYLVEHSTSSPPIVYDNQNHFPGGCVKWAAWYFNTLTTRQGQQCGYQNKKCVEADVDFHQFSTHKSFTHLSSAVKTYTYGPKTGVQPVEYIEVTSGAPVPITQEECKLYAAADTSSLGWGGSVQWCDDYPNGCIRSRTNGWTYHVTGCSPSLDCGNVYNGVALTCIHLQTVKDESYRLERGSLPTTFPFNTSFANITELECYEFCKSRQTGYVGAERLSDGGCFCSKQDCPTDKRIEQDNYVTKFTLQRDYPESSNRGTCVEKGRGTAVLPKEFSAEERVGACAALCRDKPGCTHFAVEENDNTILNQKVNYFWDNNGMKDVLPDVVTTGARCKLFDTCSITKTDYTRRFTTYTLQELYDASLLKRYIKNHPSICVRNESLTIDFEANAPIAKSIIKNAYECTDVATNGTCASVTREYCKVIGLLEKHVINVPEKPKGCFTENVIIYYNTYNSTSNCTANSQCVCEGDSIKDKNGDCRLKEVNPIVVLDQDGIDVECQYLQSENKALCAQCNCFSGLTYGFWSNIMCDTCAVGYGKEQCRTICADYDGETDKSMCGGYGKCLYGSEVIGNERVFQLGKCMCGQDDVFQEREALDEYIVTYATAELYVGRPEIMELQTTPIFTEYSAKQLCSYTYNDPRLIPLNRYCFGVVYKELLQQYFLDMGQASSTRKIYDRYYSKNVVSSTAQTFEITNTDFLQRIEKATQPVACKSATEILASGKDTCNHFLSSEKSCTRCESGWSGFNCRNTCQRCLLGGNCDETPSEIKSAICECPASTTGLWPYNCCPVGFRVANLVEWQAKSQNEINQISLSIDYDDESTNELDASFWCKPCPGIESSDWLNPQAGIKVCGDPSRGECVPGDGINVCECKKNINFNTKWEGRACSCHDGLGDAFVSHTSPYGCIIPSVGSARCPKFGEDNAFVFVDPKFYMLDMKYTSDKLRGDFGGGIAFSRIDGYADPWSYSTPIQPSRFNDIIIWAYKDYEKDYYEQPWRGEITVDEISVRIFPRMVQTGVAPTVHYVYNGRCEQSSSLTGTVVNPTLCSEFCQDQDDSHVTGFAFNSVSNTCVCGYGGFEKIHDGMVCNTPYGLPSYRVYGMDGVNLTDCMQRAITENAPYVSFRPSDNKCLIDTTCDPEDDGYDEDDGTYWEIWKVDCPTGFIPGGDGWNSYVTDHRLSRTVTNYGQWNVHMFFDGEGPCYTDTDCAGTLKCFHRFNGETKAGYDVTSIGMADNFCYDDNTVASNGKLGCTPILEESDTMFYHETVDAQDTQTCTDMKFATWECRRLKNIVGIKYFDSTTQQYKDNDIGYFIPWRKDGNNNLIIQRQQYPCPIGTYGSTLKVPSYNMHSCAYCNVGFYQDEVGQTSCKKCVGVQQYERVGAISGGDCVACAAGKYNTGDNTCSDCPPGKYGPRAFTGGTAGIGICVECPDGTYAHSEGTPEVEDGGNLVVGATPVSPLSVGRSTWGCEPCPPGTYGDSSSAYKRTMITQHSFGGQCGYQCAGCGSYYSQEDFPSYPGRSARTVNTAKCLLVPASSSSSNRYIQGYYNAYWGQTSYYTCHNPSYFSWCGQAGMSYCPTCRIYYPGYTAPGYATYGMNVCGPAPNYGTSYFEEWNDPVGQHTMQGCSIPATLQPYYTQCHGGVTGSMTYIQRL